MVRGAVEAGKEESKGAFNTMVSYPSEEKNDHFIDLESIPELARQMQQSRLITKGMGGLFQERSDMHAIRSILDIGCGPGGWVIDVAFAYPHIEVMGIDISEQMVKFAFAQAQSQRLPNASFEVMDMTQLLAFSDDTLDMVNIRLVSMIPTKAWPRVLQECRRILKPGGILRWTDSEWGMTNSPAYEQLKAWLQYSLKREGKLFSPDGRHVGITPVMKKLVKDAGFINVQHKAYAMDFSMGSEDCEAFRQNWVVAWRLLIPFILKAGGISPDEVERVYQQMVVEIAEENFCGLMYLLKVGGDKPA